MNRTKLSLMFAIPLLLSAMILPAVTQAADKPPPNIVVIMGDDIGWSNIGVYNQGMMPVEPPILTSLPLKACASLITTPRPVARPGAPTSSPVNCRSVPA